MINYLPGFFGPGEFLWFLLRCVPQGPGAEGDAVRAAAVFFFLFPIVAQDLSLFTFSPLLQRGRRAQFGLIGHSSQVITRLMFHPHHSVLKFKIKPFVLSHTCDSKKKAELYQ